MVEPAEVRRDCARTGEMEDLPMAERTEEALFASPAALADEPERTRGAAVEIDSAIGP